MAKLIIILIILALFLALITSAYSLPFVVFHGISHSCNDLKWINFTQNLINWSGSQGYCIEIGNGKRDSWLMPMTKQTEIACEKVKNISALSDGYNIVGLSQGNILSRAVIEFCEDAPQVHNYVSVAGPHAGIAWIPKCGNSKFCNLVGYILKYGIYTNYVQKNLAPTGYLKIPTNINQYMKGSTFLPKLNNEYKYGKNAVYTKRFASLQNLVLILCNDDQVLFPKETQWFGYFSDGSWTNVLPVQETPLYKEDWIGLRSLDEAGRVHFVNVSGKHLRLTPDEIKKYIVPYLERKIVIGNEDQFP